MNREIKCKAYIKKSKEVVEVKSLHLNTRKAIIGYSKSKTNYGNYSISFDDIELMQYTGLKDKNGKEIYEGDIIQILGGEYEQGFYEWNEKVQIKDLIYDGFNLMMTISQIGNKAIEVIGNIYENPELLKED